MSTTRETPPQAAGAWAYFIDFDGTLVEFAPTPDAITVTSDLRDLLRGLANLTGGAAAIVTGRSTADIDHFLNLPELAVAGQHGLEWRRPHSLVERETGPILPAGITAAGRDWAAAHPGTLAETKEFSVAIHVRNRPELFDEALAFARELVARAPDKLKLQPGVLVVEVRCQGADKGAAVERFMGLPGFHGRKPVFLGDDLTDEDGFKAAKRLGGFGILVGDERRSEAGYRLDNPRAVRHWLEGLRPQPKPAPHPFLARTPRIPEGAE